MTHNYFRDHFDWPVVMISTTGWRSRSTDSYNSRQILASVAWPCLVYLHVLLALMFHLSTIARRSADQKIK